VWLRLCEGILSQCCSAVVLPLIWAPSTCQPTTCRRCATARSHWKMAQPALVECWCGADREELTGLGLGPLASPGLFSPGFWAGRWTLQLRETAHVPQPAAAAELNQRHKLAHTTAHPRLHQPPYSPPGISGWCPARRNSSPHPNSFSSPSSSACTCASNSSISRELTSSTTCTCCGPDCCPRIRRLLPLLLDSTAFTMSRPISPVSGAYGSFAHPESLPSARPAFTSSKPNSHVGSGAAGPSGLNHSQLSLHSQGAPNATSVLSQAADMQQDGVEAGHLDSLPDAPRSESRMSQSHLQPLPPSKPGTLKKKASLKRTASLRRTASRRSSYAGSVKSLKLGDKEKYGTVEANNSAFFCPVPTSGSPTELLAARFQGMPSTE
jgi:hypothetical protein